MHLLRRYDDDVNERDERDEWDGMGWDGMCVD